MPYCADCDEWFEGTEKEPATCEHCNHVNHFDIIKDQSVDPEDWRCKDKLEFRTDLFPVQFTAASVFTVAFAAPALLDFTAWSYAIPFVVCPVALVIIFGKRILRITAREDRLRFEWIYSSFGRKLFTIRTKRQDMGAVWVKATSSGRSLIRLGGEVFGVIVTGFDDYNSALRFANLLAKHCRLQVQIGGEDMGM